VHVVLPPKLEELIRRKVEAGAYSTPDEVICEALRLLAAREAEDEVKLEALRAAIDAGMRSGVVEDFSMDRLNDELDRHFDEESRKPNSGRG